MKLLQASFLLAAAAAATQAHAQSLQDLGSLAGSASSYGNAISANGLVVVGESGDYAFRWAGGVMSSLGTLADSLSSGAYGVSADGNVVVGYTFSSSGGNQAFRWTGGVMSSLGSLPGGSESNASGVSADGSVIVGQARDSAGANHAFRWTDGLMTDLGTLPGGSFSDARAVSEDGSVVVGFSSSSVGFRAFRWASGVMTDLGTLPGGSSSFATDVSANGTVVVGNSGSSVGQRAFRWTGGLMTSLGTLPGGSSSGAGAVSADGNVVVGVATNASGDDRAFRWAGGVMTDLGTLPGGESSYANGVSADGSVVVGSSYNAEGEERAFLYRNSVMLDVQDWLGSVGGVYSMLSTSLELTRLHLEGAHHRPLAELGRGKSYWATGDIAGSSRSRDLITRSGEAGATFEPWTNVLVGVGAGYGRQDQQLLNDGSSTTFGQYLIGELDFLLADGGIVSVLVSSGDWENETGRGYVTGGGVDYSHGETDIKSTAFRMRYDSPVLTKALGADVKAYASYGQSRARAEGFVETDGSNPGSFGAMEQNAQEGRVGIAATRGFGEKFRGRLSAEWIRRFDREQTSITATDLTSTLDLTLPGAPVVRDQARFGFDLDYLMDAKTTLSFTVHAAGRGEVADVSGAVSLRRAF